MKYLMEIKNFFFQYGIKSVTMDDISKKLKISKKTLYKFFKNKDEIVSTLMEFDIEEERKQLEIISKNTEDAIEEIYSLSTIIIEKLKNINPSVIYDLEKYHTEAWGIFNQYKKKDIYNCIKLNLDRGISEGLYRKSMDSDIIAKLYSDKIDVIFDSELFPNREYSFQKIYEEMINYHLKGIVNREGLKKIKESE